MGYLVALNPDSQTLWYYFGEKFLTMKAIIFGEKFLTMKAIIYSFKKQFEELK